MTAAAAAEQKQPKDERVAPTIVGDKRTTYPCSLIVLNDTRRIVGDDAAQRVSCIDDAPGHRWTATWLPALGVFEVQWFPAQRNRAPETCYITQESVKTFHLK